MRSKLVLLAILLLLPSVLAVDGRDHNETTVDRVMVVEEVLHVREVDRVLEPKVSVGATEYTIGEEAKIFVQLDINGVAVLNATCRVNAWFYNSTPFIVDEFMVPLDKGIFFHDFIAPNATGVLPVNVECTYLTVLNFFLPENLNVTEGSLDGGSIGDTYFINGETLQISESVASSRGFAMTVDFINTTIDNTSIILSDTFVRRVRQPADPDFDFIEVWAFNFSSGQFAFIDQGLDYSDTFKRRLTLVSGVSTDFIDANGTLRLLINDTLRGANDNKDTTLEVDLLRLLVISTQQNTTVQTVRGGGEIHMSQAARTIDALGSQVAKPLMFDLEEVLLLVWIFLLCLLPFVHNRMYWFGVGFFTLFLGLGFFDELDVLFLVSLMFAAILILLGGLTREFGKETNP